MPLRTCRPKKLFGVSALKKAKKIINNNNNK